MIIWKVTVIGKNEIYNTTSGGVEFKELSSQFIGRIDDTDIIKSHNRSTLGTVTASQEFKSSRNNGL